MNGRSFDRPALSPSGAQGERNFQQSNDPGIGMGVRPKVLRPPPQCHLSLDNPESQCPNLNYVAHVRKAKATSIIRYHPFVLRLSKDTP